MTNHKRRQYNRLLRIRRDRRLVIKERRRRRRLIAAQKERLERRGQPKLAKRREKVILPVPPEFCFATNPEEVNRFIVVMRRHMELNHDITLNFREVERVGSDAIIMLLAHSKDAKLQKGARIDGNFPRKHQPAQVLKQSGFFDHVVFKERIGGCSGKIQRRKGKRVDSEVITDLIRFASEKLFGDSRKMKGVYRIFIEAMANTRDHASAKEGEIEKWWTTAYFDDEENKVVFSLVDTGVGIFQSAKLRFLMDSALVALGFRNRADVLASIMEGEIGSRTGIPFRGKGLPAMKRVYDRGQISNLIVAANDALINYGTNDKRVLKTPVHGTVITWEYRTSCK